MSHGSARLTVHGRRLIVQRHQAGWPKAHIAAAMGVSRKCVAVWVERFATEGETGLYDRSSRPHRMPTKSSAEVEQQIIEIRRLERRGPDWIGAELGVAPRTVSRVLARHDLPRLAVLDPITGEVIRASKVTTVRYERETTRRGRDMDAKSSAGSPTEAVGVSTAVASRESASNGTRLRLRPLPRRRPLPPGLTPKILADEEGPDLRERSSTARIDYLHRPRHHPDRTAHDRQRLGLPLVAPRALHRGRDPAGLHSAALPMAERQGGKAQPNPAHRVGLPTGIPHQRPSAQPALAPWLEHYNTQRRHSALGGLPPITRLLPT